MKTLEEHCSDFILRHCSKPNQKAYQDLCYDFWTERYGEQFVLMVKKLTSKGLKNETSTN